MKPSTSTCLFCEMSAGRASALVVHQTASVLVILDHRPVFKGHCLVIPRRHYETLTDVVPVELGPFFEEVQRVARAVETGLLAEGTFVAMNNRVSQSVPHLHVHVVPRRKKDGLRGFFWPRHTYDSPEEAATIRDALARAL